MRHGPEGKTARSSSLDQVAIGFSSGAELIFRGKTWQRILSLAFFCGIAVVVEIVRSTGFSGVVIGALILIGIGHAASKEGCLRTDAAQNT
jgi:putative copper export protein